MFKEEMAEELSKTERQKFLLLRTITNPKRDKKNIYHPNIGFAGTTEKVNLSLSVMWKTGRGSELHIIKFV